MGFIAQICINVRCVPTVLMLKKLKWISKMTSTKEIIDSDDDDF